MTPEGREALLVKEHIIAAAYWKKKKKKAPQAFRTDGTWCVPSNIRQVSKKIVEKYEIQPVEPHSSISNDIITAVRTLSVPVIRPTGEVHTDEYEINSV